MSESKLIRGKDSSGPYYKWGKDGERFYYTINDFVSRNRAKIKCMESVNMSGKGVYDKVGNYLFSKKDKNKMKDGEKHAILYTDNGLEPAMFMGPGTQTYERILELQKEGKPLKGLTEADTASLLHDIQYGLARNAEDIRKADLHFINTLKEISKKNKDYGFNVFLGRTGIKLKMLLEDLGLSADAFTKYGSAQGDVEKVYREVEKKLLQEGYGARRFK
jgi:hypothetical protein